MTVKINGSSGIIGGISIDTLDVTGSQTIGGNLGVTGDHTVHGLSSLESSQKFLGEFASFAHVDVTPASKTYAPGERLELRNFSGMVVATSATNGNTTLWICGGGGTLAVGSSTGVAPGTMTYDGTLAGYYWQNTVGYAQVMAFYLVRTRTSG